RHRMRSNDHGRAVRTAGTRSNALAGSPGRGCGFRLSDSGPQAARRRDRDNLDHCSREGCQCARGEAGSAGREGAMTTPRIRAGAWVLAAAACFIVAPAHAQVIPGDVQWLPGADPFDPAIIGFEVTYPNGGGFSTAVVYGPDYWAGACNAFQQTWCQTGCLAA